jgi:hypothetical protein
MGKKEEAKVPLRRAKELGAPADEIGALANKIDPAFATELGVEGKPEPAPPPKKGRGGRRGR